MFGGRYRGHIRFKKFQCPLIGELHQDYFGAKALKLVETLIHGCEALLMLFARYVSFTIDSLCDEFLFCDFLGVNAASEAIFKTWPADIIHV